MYKIVRILPDRINLGPGYGDGEKRKRREVTA